MPANPAPTVAPRTIERKTFSLDEANRALTYIGPIVRDIRNTYRQAIDIQQRLELPLAERETRDLTEDHDRAMARLTHYVEELSDTGVELKDYELGLVDFPATRGGRHVLLCWKLGEKTIGHWHETDAGFAGREPIAGVTFDD